MTSNNYPVYMKESLLNSNQDFDYGEFRQLASALAAGQSINTFVFLFEEKGIYVLADNKDIT